VASKGEKYSLKKIPSRVYEVTKVSGSVVVLKGPGNLNLEMIVSLNNLSTDYKKES
jgi:hypothetical protein